MRFSIHRATALLQSCNEVYNMYHVRVQSLILQGISM